MPVVNNYIAEVTVSVVLRTMEAGVVAEYGVTRKHGGSSSTRPASDVIESALTSAASAARIVAAGVDNAEARRLK